jgi:Lrp/AsnC family leucine-responsive transcriptional regulator
MSLIFKKLLDSSGQQLLKALQENARLSYSELGRLVGLSTPAVSERIQRLEEAGVIKGYTAEVDAEKIGYPLMVFMRLHTPPERYPRVLALADSLPEVLEVYHVTGEEAFILKLAVPSVSRLEELIKELSPFGKTSTSIVLSNPVKRRGLPVNL